MSQVNCPTCGAKTNSLISNCEYCGIEIKRAAESKLTPQEIIGALTKRIKDCPGPFGGRLGPSTIKQAEVISEFILPTDINALAEFFLFCHGNIQSGGYMAFMKGNMDPTQAAWKAKARAAYERLRLASLNNPQMGQFIAPFNSDYGAQSSQGSKGLLGGFSKLFGR